MSYIREVLKSIRELDSPNQVMSLVVGKEFIYARMHDCVSGEKALLLPFDSNLLDGEDPLFFLNERVFGCMEDLYIHDDYVSSPAVDIYLAKAESNGIRLSCFGSFSSEEELESLAMKVDEGLTGIDLGLPSFRGIKDFSRIYPLQPEHYEWDKSEATVSYFRGIEEQYSSLNFSDEDSIDDTVEDEVLTEEVPLVEEEVEEDVEGSSEYLDDALAYYAAHIDTVVSDIVSNYTKLFKAGYQLKRPVGILGDNGEAGQLMTLSGSTQKFTKPNPVIRALYQLTVAEYGLTVLPYRSVNDIASTIVNGITPDGKKVSPDAKLYFPYKMLEYAYGRRTPKPTEGGTTNYPKHSDKLNWESYATEVDESLRKVTRGIVKEILINTSEIKYFEPQVESSVSDSLKKFKDVFNTCILVSEFPLIKGLPSLLKVRLLYPHELVSNSNIATDAMRIGISSKGTKPFEGIPIHDGNFHLYTHEYNHALANSKPIYAYHAAKSLKESGHTVNYANMILGIGVDDSILQNGSGEVSLYRNLSHFVVADSRAGKGVDSMAKLAQALRSGKPVFYLDNKPDMGAALLDIEPNAFVVNGSNPQQSKEGGTNLSGHFLEGDRLSYVDSQNMPKYLYNSSKALFNGRRYSDLGIMFYTRALTLIMAITYFRTQDDLASKAGLGGSSDGIVAFFDEFNVSLSQIDPIMMKIYMNGYARTDYMESERNARESGKKNTVRPPSPEEYWGTSFVESLKNFAELLNSAKNAGYKNKESSASDIFIVGQDLPDVIEDMTDLDDFFPTHRGKNTTRAQFASGGGSHKNHPLVALVTPGGSDLFLGQTRGNHPNYLNQTKGYASDKLDTDARMFGYIPQYNRVTKKIIESGNEDFARNNVTYYKPLLLLADHDMDKYFFKNAISYAIKSGIDAESIVIDNAQEDEQGNPIKYERKGFSDINGTKYSTEYRVHEAVGFKGYLEYIGMSQEDISRSLTSASDMAQRVVDAFGYDGTWREFIQDLRPDWFLHGQNMVESLRTGQNLADLNAKTFSEFREVYPEAFVESDISRLSDEAFEDDADISVTDYESLGDSDSFVYSVPEVDSPEGVQEIHKQDGLFDDVELPTDDSVFERTQDMKFDHDEHLSDLTLGEILSLPDEEKIRIFKMLSEGLERSTPIEFPNDGELGYGRLGVVHDDNGRAYKVDTSQVDLSNSAYDEVVLDKNMSNLDGDIPEITYPALVKTVTDKVLATAQLSGGIKTIEVIGGSLIVNDVVIGLKIKEALLKGLNSVIAQSIREGRLANYFNWRVIKRSRIVSIKVDSSRYVLSELSPALGYGTHFNVQELFEDVKSLQKFVVNSSIYTRKSVKELADNVADDEFYRPRMSERGYRLSQAWLSRKRVDTWQGAVDTWKRKDLGTFRKLGSSVVLAGGSALAGTTQATGWVGRKLFRGIGKTVGELKDVIDKSNGLRKK